MCLFLRSFGSLCDSANAVPDLLDTIWQAASQLLEPEVGLVPSTHDDVPLQWAHFLITMEMTAHDSGDQEGQLEQSEDPIRISTVFLLVSSAAASDPSDLLHNRTYLRLYHGPYPDFQLLHKPFYPVIRLDRGIILVQSPQQLHQHRIPP